MALTQSVGTIIAGGLNSYPVVILMTQAVNGWSLN